MPNVQNTLSRHSISRTCFALLILCPVLFLPTLLLLLRLALPIAHAPRSCLSKVWLSALPPPLGRTRRHTRPLQACRSLRPPHKEIRAFSRSGLYVGQSGAARVTAYTWQARWIRRRHSSANFRLLGSSGGSEPGNDASLADS